MTASQQAAVHAAGKPATVKDVPKHHITNDAVSKAESCAPESTPTADPHRMGILRPGAPADPVAPVPLSYGQKPLPPWPTRSEVRVSKRWLVQASGVAHNADNPAVWPLYSGGGASGDLSIRTRRGGAGRKQFPVRNAWYGGPDPACSVLGA